MLLAPRIIAPLIWLLLAVQILTVPALTASARASEPVHHDITLVLVPEEGTLTVTDKITVSGRDRVSLKVAPWMRMSEIRIDGKSVDNQTPGDAFTLALPSKGKHLINVTVNGVIPKSDQTTKKGNAGSEPISSKDGVFLPSWIKWFPRLTDEALTYRLIIRTPAGYRAVATGKLLSEELNGDPDGKSNKSTFESQAGFEAPSVFAGPYTVTEERVGDIRLRTYFHDGSPDLAATYLEASARYIRQFEAQIGAYPFTEFHVISAPLPVGLGFPNLTYVDRRILPLPFMRGRSLAHEVLHNWWANGVQVDYETGNWAEGLTSYMADHALAEQRGPDAAVEMRLAWLRDYAALPEEQDIAVNRFISKQHDASQVIGYGKVAQIFHMLKHEVGPEQFDAAIKQFWRDNKFTRAGWSQIRAAFETAVGGDLGWFFHQWIERSGAPDISLGETSLSKVDNGYKVQIKLSQAPDFYRLKVPVEVTTETGTHHFDIRLEGGRVVEDLSLKSKPIALHIDPRHTLFRRLLPGEAPPILRDVLLDADAKVIVLEQDPDAQAAARKLTERLFAGKPKYISGETGSLPDSPSLVFGSQKQIDQFIARFALPQRPAEIAGKGNGLAWVARRDNGTAVLFVETGSADELRAMSRPLPHYRSRSYVVFEGSRAIAKGVWPVTDSPLTRRFE